jgi:hypothetical protein
MFSATCAVCGTTKNVACCQGCKSKSYCSVEHQRSDWRACHKQECSRLAVWERPLASLIAALPARTPISPFLNGASYIEHVYWTGGMTASEALGARFCAALQRAWATLGAGAPSAAQRDCELSVLSAPFVLLAEAGASAKVQFKPCVPQWSTAMRSIVTPLPAPAARAVLQLCERLAALPHSHGATPVHCAVPEVPLDMGECATDLLSCVLNKPAGSSCYVFCAAAEGEAGDEVLVAAVGRLDEAKLDLAIRSVIKSPPSERMAPSQLICFFCGANPVAAGVQLSACDGCKLVAYCGDKCATMDWCEHSKECSLPCAKVVHQPTGTTAVCARALSNPRRGQVEMEPAIKPRCCMSPVTVAPPPQGVWAPARLSRLILRPNTTEDFSACTPFWAV